MFGLGEKKTQKLSWKFMSSFGNAPKFGTLPNIRYLVIFVFCLFTLLTEANPFDRVTVKRGQYRASHVDVVPDVESLPDLWYSQYMDHENISDSHNLSVPTKENVKAWEKKYIQLPYPPRYTRTRLTKDDRDVGVVLDRHYGQLQKYASRLEFAYVEYKSYNLDITKINAICGMLRTVTQSRAWANYWERTTRVRNRSNDELTSLIGGLGREIDNLFRPLVAIKDKEYEQWAAAHPQAAANIMFKRRLTNLEQVAIEAELSAEKAKQMAVEAKQAAVDAEYRADSAEARATAAESRATAAELEAQDSATRRPR